MWSAEKQVKTIFKDGVSLGDESGLHFRASSMKVGALRPAWTLKNTGFESGYGKIGSGGGLDPLVACIIRGTSPIVDFRVWSIFFFSAASVDCNRRCPKCLMGILSDLLKGGMSESAKPETLINSSRKDASSNLT